VQASPKLKPAAPLSLETQLSTVQPLLPAMPLPM
jgi:hypothetical protein